MDAIDLTEEDQPADSADVEALEVQLVSVEAELHEVTCSCRHCSWHMLGTASQVFVHCYGNAVLLDAANAARGRDGSHAQQAAAAAPAQGAVADAHQH